MKSLFITILSCFILLFFGCTYDSEDDLIAAPNDDEIIEDDQDDNPTSSINYNDDVKPIMEASCVSCHGDPPTNGAPFGLINFTQVMQRGEAVFNAMNRQSGAAGAMPPSGRLPQTTIDIIREWIDNGMPEN